MKTKKMILAIPTGSLQEVVLRLLRKIGLEIPNPGRKIIVEIQGNDIFDRAVFIRPQKLPLYLKRGKVDAGFCGFDTFIEENSENQIIAELNFGRAGLNPVKVIVFGNKKIRDSKNVVVSSEYMSLAKKIFPKAQIIYSCGGTEADIALRVADYGVGITETGASLKENGLQILKTILISPAIFLAKEAAPEMTFFGQQLQGALKAELFQLLKFNVRPELLKSILQILPSAESPTVNNLVDGNLAIETVAPKAGISNLILKLQKIGANGILIQDFNILS